MAKEKRIKRPKHLPPIEENTVEKVRAKLKRKPKAPKSPDPSSKGAIRISRQKAALDDLEVWLQAPEQKNRVVAMTEAAKALNRHYRWFYVTVGAVEFAQLYLRVNPDCDSLVRHHYEQIVAKEVGKSKTNMTLNIQARDGKRTSTPIEHQNVRGKLGTLDEIAKTKISYHDSMTEKAPNVEAMTAREQIIWKIREKYVNAPIGDAPSVDAIMKEFGIVDDKGNPTGDITPTEIRQAFISQDWRDARKMSLHRTWDVIDDEIRMVTTVRNLEVQKIIYNTIKLQARAATQYFTQGYVESINRDPDTGRPIRLNITPDPGVIGSLAEVMRRMTSDNRDLTININQFNSLDAQNSVFIKQYANTLTRLSENDLQQEIDRIKTIRTVLDDGFQDALLREAIEADFTIDGGKNDKS